MREKKSLKYETAVKPKSLQMSPAHGVNGVQEQHTHGHRRGIDMAMKKTLEGPRCETESIPMSDDLIVTRCVTDLFSTCHQHFHLTVLSNSMMFL